MAASRSACTNHPDGQTDRQNYNPQDRASIAASCGKKAILQCKRRLTAVTKPDRNQFSTSSVESLLRLLITD